MREKLGGSIKLGYRCDDHVLHATTIIGHSSSSGRYLIIYEVPAPGRVENKTRADKKVVPKKKSRAKKKKSCRKKRVVPKKTVVPKKKKSCRKKKSCQKKSCAREN